LAGYSLGEADLMRRAMGKKKREEMAVHQEKFVEGAVQRNIKREKAEEIFNLMAQFADYGFNRSHSVAYAYLAFQTAYLKAHYPAYFYAAVLSNESDDTAKIYKYSNELRQSGLKFLPPDVNESDAGFTPLDNAVRFGLTAIKGIGSTSVQAIIEARRQQGKFASLYDFTSRIEQGAINRRGLESLITAGAFDSLMPAGGVTVNLWRAKLFSAIEASLSHSQKIWNDKVRGQNALFGGSGEDGFTSAPQMLPDVEPWSPHKLSQAEKAAVGFYLSNHPLNDFKKILEDLKIKNLADYLEINPGDRITLAGIVSALQVRHIKKGNRFCIFKLEDQSTGVKCLAWSEAFTRFADILKEDELIIVTGKVESTEGQEITLILDEVQKLDDAVPSKAQKVSITVTKESADEKILEEIFAMLSRHQGKCDVYFNLLLADNISVSLLSQPLRINGTRNLENELSRKGCKVRWELS
jgi:DNA polymerase-3 subunit alpha